MLGHSNPRTSAGYAALVPGKAASVVAQIGAAYRKRPHEVGTHSSSPGSGNRVNGLRRDEQHAHGDPSHIRPDDGCEPAGPNDLRGHRSGIDAGCNHARHVYPRRADRAEARLLRREKGEIDAGVSENEQCNVTLNDQGAKATIRVTITIWKDAAAEQKSVAAVKAYPGVEGAAGDGWTVFYQDLVPYDVTQILQQGTPVNITAAPASPTATAESLAATAKTWPTQWCKAAVGMTPQQVAALMGPPTEPGATDSTSPSDSWDYAEYQFNAFYDVSGKVRQLDINDYQLSASEKASLRCATTRR